MCSTVVVVHFFIICVCVVRFHKKIRRGGKRGSQQSFAPETACSKSCSHVCERRRVPRARRCINLVGSQVEAIPFSRLKTPVGKLTPKPIQLAVWRKKKLFLVHTPHHKTTSSFYCVQDLYNSVWLVTKSMLT